MEVKKILISHIITGSIAEEAGIEPGDFLIAINEEKVQDVFHYRFLIADENLTLQICKADGEEWEIEIEKDQYEDLGMEFQNSMLDEAKRCNNGCIFCFIDQMPKGMRETLYFKDDDSRLSFLMGNYVTLTNMSDDEIDSIIRFRLSPINVSVHTTNPDLRKMMLKNRFAGNVLERIGKLVDAGITVNCQIVLCKGINDGLELDRSLKDLGSLAPGLRSISIVPVGISRYREGLYPLEPFDPESVGSLITRVEDWQSHFMGTMGSRLVYLADEFYILAGADLPGYEEYEDFPQIENGVGMLSMMEKEFQEALEALDVEVLHMEGERAVSIATGVAAFPFVKGLVERLEARLQAGGIRVKIDVYEIRNTFFGEHVTVAGLLTGGDIHAQLEGKTLGDSLFITKSMLKADEEIFLDDVTLSDLGRRLGVEIIPVENDGAAFVEALLGKERLD